MAQEIERKFLVASEAWRGLGEAVHFSQGYLSADHERIVRVRLAGALAWLTIKGAAHGSSRAEYEYEIPADDARAMLADLILRPIVEKQRSRIPHGGLIWEVDEFLGDNAGLIVAEVELTSVGQPVELPEWIGREVTGDSRYYNSNLLKNPYSRWRETV